MENKVDLIQELEDNPALKRFITINLDFFKLLSAVQYASVETEIKDGKFHYGKKHLDIKR